MELSDKYAMPENFKYREVILKGKPRHSADDPFLIRHPKMDLARRAKLFAPFDALRGFSAAVIAKDERYEARKEMDAEILEDLNQKISLLCELTATKKLAHNNNVQVSVTYFETCSDTNSEAFETDGKYLTVTGICMHVDPDVSQTILVDETLISFKDIIRIEIIPLSAALK